MDSVMRKFPIGIQNFESLITLPMIIKITSSIISIDNYPPLFFQSW